MGIIPNTIMYNTAMSSLGKSGQWEAAERLFSEVPEPDAVTYETLIAAYGMAGQANQAEIALKYMLEAHHRPRDYAYCGLIAAHRWAYAYSLPPVCTCVYGMHSHTLHIGYFALTPGIAPVTLAMWCLLCNC